ncbi:MAG: bifunctional 2-polyprenyl-6-hydroxyphenol methylase/3-demethylubiquinol 3-O-methyltransferase UbiG [Proteobacteria bacterium]|nr:bifunctional 2-polyprenyl-6-hydroxyphenol methylase/3-demethylubiquinol 3-O-methyltransferase UbiG [Pseudomonadota bacterium]
MSTANNSVDDDEIARFEAIAESWWDVAGPFRPLHKLNPIRLLFIRDTIGGHFGQATTNLKPLAGLSVLDIGCGGGLISEPMAKMGAAITGIDPSSLNTSIATMHAQQSVVDVNYRTSTVETLADEGAQFDVVLNLEVVEHVSDVQGFLDASANVVKPGGLMICSTLNRTVKSFALAKIGAEYIMRWLPAGTHSWQKFLTPSELAGHMRRAGLSVTHIKGMSYAPLKDRWTLSDDTSVNYFMVAEK